MILIINICKEKLHYFEFVKPLEDILKKLKIGFFTKYYRQITNKDLEKADRIIICGTSLKDNEFSLHENLRFFSWIRDFKKPLLGICGGMQVIGLMFGGRIKKESEIGFFKENFEKNFLGLEGVNEVYHLHNYFISLPDSFEEFSVSESNIPQAIKHGDRLVFGVLFHPEVRNKILIENFCRK